MLLWEILLNRWTVLVIGVLFMMIGLKPDWLMYVVRTVGKMGWAESSVGRGGTFTIWKIIGILAPIAAIIYFFSGGVQFSQPDTTQTQSQNYTSNY
ncbi:MAG: hypothetical protein NTZ65_04175 [Candidatus Berkelbacteria bacterium]|nr:hypothetical protein [Candidatus Berkelbacteria bacterium]